MTLLNVNTYLVRKKMEEIGLSINTLAQKSHISRRTIKRIISGEQDRTNHLPSIAKALGTKTYDIQKAYSQKQLDTLFGSNDIPF